MSPNSIREMIQKEIPDSQVETSGENCNFSVVVTSAAFAGKSPIQRHRMVNDIFKEQFASGELHALSIKTRVE
ncbi:BolA/IbaG family iron-sulfur metabolism protein [Thiomicrorhabdus sp.]|uniref:BolA family protein n=1 Tax=Thiomicrorhabdus sp. TaxID=2039724 RepID=UPI0029C83EE7|nr:BolA/IbaG family iron-sulfur metabolism protein [Thiomicrorhabdus sp.]